MMQYVNNINQFMLKPRNKRIKTDYNHPYLNQITPILKCKQQKQTLFSQSKSLSNQPKQTFLSRILASIKGQIQYNQMTDNQIRIQHESLKQKVRDLSSIVTKEHSKSLQRKSSAQRISHKAIITKNLGMNMSQSYIINTHILSKLSQEYTQQQQKLQYLSDLDKEMTFDKKKLSLMIICKQLRQQLGRMKKNKHLRQKQLIKCSSVEYQQIEELRCQYVKISKKLENVTDRFKTSQKDLVDSQYNLMKVKQNYQEIKDQFNNIIEEEQHLKQEENVEHLALIYSNKRKKMELILRKIQRDQQNKKRKYYNHLLQLQTLNQRKVKISQEIIITTNRNQRQLEFIDEFVELIDQVKQNSQSKSSFQPPPKHHSILTNDSSFFMTNLNQEDKGRVSSPNHSPINQIMQLQKYGSSCSQKSQKKFNENIIMKRSKIRKWNRNLDSIIRGQDKDKDTQVRRDNIKVNEDLNLNLKQRIIGRITKTEDRDVEFSFNRISINQFNENNK